jgi:hypothetical protein
VARAVEIKGGDKLDAYLREAAKNLKKASSLRVGFLEDATYPDGTPVATVAAFQNFGTGKIPPRPFFSNMVAAYGPTWPDKIAKLLKATDFDAEKTLALLGQDIAADLEQSILDTTGPALSQITLMLRKMFWSNPEDITGKDVGEAAARVAAGESVEGVPDKPLEWSKTMLHSVRSEVT